MSIRKAQELSYVEWPNGEYRRVGENGVTDITLLDDGNGPSGPYDVIYISFSDAPQEVTPAHHCIKWAERPQ